MKIPIAKLKNSLRKIFYNDSCNVYRATLEKVGKTDDYSRQFLLVYENIPCHLAQYGKDISAHRDDVSQKITEDLRLTYDPKFSINENDFLEVNHAGNIFKLVAGVEFKYPTHTELSCRRRKEGGQS